MRSSLKLKKNNAFRRANRVRATVAGTAERPRLSVRISALNVSAQVINDQNGKTLAAATTLGQKVEGNMTDKAVWVGSTLAKNAKAAKVKKVVFDKGAKRYHGRIKALAEAARAGGLEF
jgi:large subunit ribosomal protein L18